MTREWPSLRAIAATILVAWAAGTAGADTPKDAIDPPCPEFQRDIRPILERRCVSCHNQEKHDGQLSFHDRKAIERGGESGNKIVNVSFEHNELWRRVAGKDVELRMPAEGAPLDAEELATLERWARAGGPGPATSPPAAAEPEESTWTAWLIGLVPAWLDPLLDLTNRLRDDYGSVLYLVAGWWTFMLVAERSKASDAKAWPFLSRIRPYATLSCYGWLGVGIAAWGTWLHATALHAREAALIARVAALEHDVRKFTEPPTAFTENLEPERPKHPRRLSGTYYRGNDERSPALFNGGFYRTATMHLALCDGDDRRLVWGDPLPHDRLVIRLEIERAPMAAPTLFSPGVMAKAFLSPCRPSTHVPDIASSVYPLETIEKGERWVGRVPLSIPPPDDAGVVVLAGDVYLYNCVPGADEIAERPHFGIRYRIVAKGNVIQRESEVWMGSLYRLGNVFYPPTDKILPGEWFDAREIPVIEGSNTSDPALLGVQEHQHKQEPAPEKKD